MNPTVVLPARPTCQICRRREAVVERALAVRGSFAFLCQPCAVACGVGPVAHIVIDPSAPFVAF